MTPKQRQARVCACGDHGFVPLTRGRVALVDAADVPLVAGHLWHTTGSGRGLTAARTVRDSGKTSRVLMHRFLVRAPADKEVDHRNHDAFDNRRRNLRICDGGQNMRNRRGWVGYKGVDPVRGRWRAVICVDYRQHHIGTFDTPEDAARAYDAAALRLHGEFALTNEKQGLLPPAYGESRAVLRWAHARLERLEAGA